MWKLDALSFGLICAVAALAGFMFDVSQSLGVAGGVPYVLLVLLGLVADRRRVVIALASVASVLTLVGWGLSGPGAAETVVLINRSLALVAIWTVAAAVSLVVVQRRQLDGLVTRDWLSGAYNRSHYFNMLQQQINIWRREGGNLGLLVFDIDALARVNDRYGHQAGDRVLRGVASIAMSSVPADAPVCRLDGDKFAVILPGAEIDDARSLADALRQAIGASEFSLGEDRVGVTISSGCAALSAGHADAAALTADADLALLQAYRRRQGETLAEATVRRLAV